MVDPLPNAFSQQASFNQNDRRLSLITAQLASGNRLTNASVDAASLAISSRIGSEVSAIRGATFPNLSQGVSNAQIIDGAQSNIQGLVDRASVLAVQAGNGALSGEERALLDTEFQNVVGEIGRIVGDTEIAGQNILQTGGDLDIRAGTGAIPDEDVISQSVTSLDTTSFAGGTFTNPNSGATETLDLTSLDIRTQDGADRALSALSAAREELVTARTETGATINRFETAQDFAATSEIFQEAARSQLADFNVAQGVIAYSNAQLLNQSQIGVLAQQNETAGSFLRLFN